MLIFHIVKFENASRVERLIENKTNKFLRTLINEFYLFAITTAFCIFLPAYEYKNYEPLTAFLAILFILDTLLVDYCKSKHIISLKNIKVHLNIVIIRRISFALSAILFIIQYYIFLSTYTFSINLLHNVGGISVLDIIWGISSKDKTALIAFPIAYLFLYFMLRILLQPIFRYLSNKRKNHYVDVILSDSGCLQNMRIIEVLNDYFVLSPYDSKPDDIFNKVVIAKDKVLYLKVHSTNESLFIK